MLNLKEFNQFQLDTTKQSELEGGRRRRKGGQRRSKSYAGFAGFSGGTGGMCGGALEAEVIAVQEQAQQILAPVEVIMESQQDLTQADSQGKDLILLGDL